MFASTDLSRPIHDGDDSVTASHHGIVMCCKDYSVIGVSARAQRRNNCLTVLRVKLPSWFVGENERTVMR
jgi:hypothetical protein